MCKEQQLHILQQQRWSHSGPCQTPWRPPSTPRQNLHPAVQEQSNGLDLVSSSPKGPSVGQRKSVMVVKRILAPTFSETRNLYKTHYPKKTVPFLLEESLNCLTFTTTNVPSFFAPSDPETPQSRSSHRRQRRLHESYPSVRPPLGFVPRNA